MTIIETYNYADHTFPNKQTNKNKTKIKERRNEEERNLNIPAL